VSRSRIAHHYKTPGSCLFVPVWWFLVPPRPSPAGPGWLVPAGTLLHRHAWDRVVVTTFWSGPGGYVTTAADGAGGKRQMAAEGASDHIQTRDTLQRHLTKEIASAAARQRTCAGAWRSDQGNRLGRGAAADLCRGVAVWTRDAGAARTDHRPDRKLRHPQHRKRPQDPSRLPRRTPDHDFLADATTPTG
jgi:hypothetical protein